MKYVAVAVLMFGLLTAPSAFAATVLWTDWTAATVGVPGTGLGTMGSTSVGYRGDVTFAQLGSGINYWTEGSPAPYTGNALVDNAPTASELIALSHSGIVNTVTFSQAIVNPIMAIVSQGRPTLPVSYDFDTPFTLLSEGQGYWGDGTYSLGAGDVLIGNELHAVIQFSGTISSISWVAGPDEYWHGFTMGAVVPEPHSILLLGIGVLAFVLRRRTSHSG